MKRKIWTPTVAWLAAVTAALAFALAGPNESNVMGRLPTLSAKRLDQQLFDLPRDLPAARTLALVGFSRGHRGQIDSWIKGLELDRQTSIYWLRMPVLNDPGNDHARAVLERKLIADHPDQGDRWRWLPLFTNREAFTRAAGVSGKHASVLVLNRNGEVLARAEGHFDPDKARALRETLLARND